MYKLINQNKKLLDCIIYYINLLNMICSIYVLIFVLFSLNSDFEEFRDSDPNYYNNI